MNAFYLIRQATVRNNGPTPIMCFPPPARCVFSRARLGRTTSTFSRKLTLRVLSYQPGYNSEVGTHFADSYAFFASHQFPTSQIWFGLHFTVSSCLESSLPAHTKSMIQASGCLQRHVAHSLPHYRDNAALGVHLKDPAEHLLERLHQD